MSSPHPFALRLLAVALTVACAGVSHAQEISPLLVANNLWYAVASNAAGTPSASVMNVAGAANVRLIRIGGHAFDGGMPSNAALLTWVDRIRAVGAEPLVQVSQYSSAATAASAVTYLNVTHGRAVRYWSIGNEPWLQAGQTTTPEATIAATIETYFKERSIAMKAVDPTIKIFGFDSEDFQVSLYNRLFGGANNIAGLVPGQSYYYCDGISWHRYPQSDASVLRPELEGLNDLRTRIQNCASLLATVNASQGRTGDAALLWGIGEFNAKNGTGVHTFGNGQMFAGVYGLSMKHGAMFAAAWSLRENGDGTVQPGQTRPFQDFSLVDGDALVPRSNYWHTQFASRYFTGTYLEGSPSISSSSSEVLVYGAEDTSRGRVSVMILNRGATARPYELRLNTTAFTPAVGSIALGVNADRPDTFSDTLAPNSTQVLVFTDETITRITYAKTDFEAATPVAPQTTVFPRLGGVPDAFDQYTDLAAQTYWTGVSVNAGAATIVDQRLVLQSSNAAFSSAAIAGPRSEKLNFFARGFTIGVSGLSLAATDVATADTHFRFSLNSSSLRSYRANDSLALRLTPAELRLGYKINQPDTQGELRAGAAATDDQLLILPLPAPASAFLLALEPDAAGPVAGVSTIHYTFQVDGAFGRIVRTGSFAASAADWGVTGESAAVLESRRENAAAGSPASQVVTTLDALVYAPGLIDDFDLYSAFAGQTYWQTLFVGSNSTAQPVAGAAVLRARADAFASAAMAGPVVPELNFFQRAFTIEARDLGLSSAGLTAEESVFRMSLNSTSARSFTSPDALTLRINPERVVLGFKLDQASADAEFRSGTAATAAPLLDFNPGGTVTSARLALAPVGPVTTAAPATVFYALRLEGSFGTITRTGTFRPELARWGAAGDSALVFEARRNRGVAATTASLMEASVGSVTYLPLPADGFATAPHFAAWQLREFTPSELAASTFSSATATPVGDGVPNLLKYAFGLSARAPADAALLPALLARPALAPVLYHEERDGSELLYQVEASTDLSTWTTPVVEESRSAPDADGWITVGTRADAPADAPRVFLRVRVSKP
ncbi:MAG: hypothetical protein H7067_11505 [Burkholderiales bacterium]|nr:hypothetical protein [Opitutaceae bacterium]